MTKSSEQKKGTLIIIRFNRFYRRSYLYIYSIIHGWLKDVPIRMKLSKKLYLSQLPTSIYYTEILRIIFYLLTSQPVQAPRWSKNLMIILLRTILCYTKECIAQFLETNDLYEYVTDSLGRYNDIVPIRTTNLSVRSKKQILV